MADRKSLLVLYRKILRGAAVYPSKNRAGIYQSIREEWRECKSLSGEKAEEKIRIAYKGLEQLHQFDVYKMTKGNPNSNHWEVTLEQNPMPKPADYDERKKKRELENFQKRS